MANTRMPTPITSRIQSLVRRRYGCSDAGPNECARHAAMRDGFAEVGAGSGVPAGAASVVLVMRREASQTDDGWCRNGQRGSTTSGSGWR